MVVGSLVLLASSGGFAALVALIGFESPRDFVLTALVAGLLPAPFLAVGIVALVIGFRRRGLMHRIVQRDGMVCPRCRHDLVMPGVEEGAPAGGPGSSPATTSITCGHCVRTWNIAEVRRGWEQWAFDPAWFGQWRRGKPVSAITSRSFARWQVVLAGCGLLALVGSVLTMVSRGASPLTSLASVRALLVGVGTIMMVLGVPRRVGASRHCAECDYAVGADEGRIDSPPGRRCPECNADWSAPGAIVHGKLVDRPLLRTLAIVAFAAAMALMLAGHWGWVRATAPGGGAAAPPAKSVSTPSPSGSTGAAATGVGAARHPAPPSSGP